MTVLDGRPLLKTRSSSMPIEDTHRESQPVGPLKRLRRRNSSKSRLEQMIVASSPGQWEKTHKERVLHASSPELFWKYYYGPEFPGSKGHSSQDRRHEHRSGRGRQSSPPPSSLCLLQQVDAFELLLAEEGESRHGGRHHRRSGISSCAMQAGEALMQRRFSVSSRGGGEAFIPDFALAKIDMTKDKFLQLDANGDNVLEFDEVSAWLRRGQPAISDKHVRELCSRFDKDHDGKINFEEFVSYLFASDLARARQRAQHFSALKKWSGPEVLEVNGVWDLRTKRCLQRFLLAQGAPTAAAAGEAKFVNGTFGSATIIALQEFLGNRTGAADPPKGHFITGILDLATTRALHELLIEEGVPTASHLGEILLDSTFGYSSICALQECLLMLRSCIGDERL